MEYTWLLLVFIVGAQGQVFRRIVDRIIKDNLLTPSDAVPDLKSFAEEYDFIVVGSGSGGSVVANRLTENSNWTVLLLEAGPEEIILDEIPLFVSHIVSSDFNWGYTTEKTDGICKGMKNQRCNWPRGKVMGGTSVTNYMVYTRGVPHDYDGWAAPKIPTGKVMGGTSVTNYMVYTRGVPHDYDGWAALGNIGWSFEEVLPYFKKSEDMKTAELKSSPYHGVGGYLKIERPLWRTPLAKCVLDAGHEMGYDIVDPSEPNAIGFSYVLANTGNGERYSASRAFLRPIRKRPNLKVAKRARVTKVLIDENDNLKRATGVEFFKNKQRHTVRARKEVILSAGALNSPQLLMLSGIGPRDHLEEMNIPVIQDLKVGYNLQDHVSMAGLVFLVNDSVTIVELLMLSGIGPRDHLEEMNIPVIEDLKVGYNLQDHVSMAGLVFLVNDSVTIVESQFQKPRYIVDYWFRRQGPYTSPGGAETMALISSKFENDKTRPDIELVFGPGALTGDSNGSLRSLLGISDKFYRKVYQPYFERQAYNIVPLILRPFSRGFVKLRSSNPFDSPKFYPNYLSDSRDLDVLIEAIKMIKVNQIYLDSTGSLMIHCIIIAHFGF
ncbi:glucose dehydrogenase [FAD, quinone]-like [Diaphorina citri]|uniref:Glucose dehydrogenase [FAD, quinone]-like n=1 Tax=Diaphorina citri TaxID=121845 RepID=A0A3Q0IN05_DIACI|nr:glucose dehydrogenase [FAD, quinone]-like [Diaphorina citri]